MTQIIELLKIYGPELAGGQFHLISPRDASASGAHVPIRIRQIFGGRRWSIALVHIEGDRA